MAKKKEVLAYRDRVLSQEHEARRTALAAWHYQVDALLEARAKSFGKASSDTFRNAVIPIFGDALDEALLELRALRLSWSSVRLLHGYTITHIPELLRDFVTLGKTFWILAKTGDCYRLGVGTLAPEQTLSQLSPWVLGKSFAEPCSSFVECGSTNGQRCGLGFQH